MPTANSGWQDAPLPQQSCRRRAHKHRQSRASLSPAAAGTATRETFCDSTTSHPEERTAESARELAEIPAIEVELEKLHQRDLATLPTSCTVADLPGSYRCPSKQRDASKAYPKTLRPPFFWDRAMPSIGGGRAPACSHQTVPCPGRRREARRASRPHSVFSLLLQGLKHGTGAGQNALRAAPSEQAGPCCSSSRATSSGRESLFPAPPHLVVAWASPECDKGHVRPGNG